MKMYFILPALYLTIGSISSAYSCTVWGAIKPNELLIAKNRDYFPGNQKFVSKANLGKYKFFGLYGDNEFDNKYIIKMGVNQTGLVAFMTFASTLPLNMRQAKVPYYQVMEKILANYQSVDSIKTNSKTLFYNSTPVNYIFADRDKAMICEIGLNNDYSCTPYQRSHENKITTFAQTNHYIIPVLTKYNLTPRIDQQTSYYRLARIMQLLNENLNNLNLNKFIKFSLDTQAFDDAPPAAFDKGYPNTYQDNSIFRTFNSHPERRNRNHPNSDQNVSTMIVELPKDQAKPIRLYLRIIKGIIDSNDQLASQKISYMEASTSLDIAINSTNSIQFTYKTFPPSLR